MTEVVTTVAQEVVVEDHEAAGCVVPTEDIVPLSQSILMFVSRPFRPHLQDLLAGKLRTRGVV